MKNRVSGIVFDQETGIVMIYLRARQPEEKSHSHREVAPGWIVDFDEAGKPIEIEILSPHKHFPKEILALLPPEFLE